MKSSERTTKIKIAEGFDAPNKEMNDVAKRNFHLKELQDTRCPPFIWPSNSVINHRPWNFNDLVLDLDKYPHIPWEWCDKHILKSIIDETKGVRKLTTDKFKYSDMSISHWGQRKLLFSELTMFEYLIDDLNNMNTDDDGRYRIINIGSAKGTHFKILDMMYSGLFSWYCYDPNKFDPILISYSQKYDAEFYFNNVFFTNKLAKQLYDKGLSKDSIFISDIRGGQSSDKDVEFDLKLQMSGIEILQPSISYLKFKLPYITLKELEHPYYIKYGIHIHRRKQDS